MSYVEICGVRRVIRPQRRYMPSRKEQDEAWSRLLSKMDAFYAEASDRLAVRSRPLTLARFLDAGICVGLLDPVSNIMANAICSSDDLQPDHTDDQVILPGAVVDEKRDELGRRSLDGLVAFLLYFFPYLPKWEAVRYLLLADADLLAAAGLIVADRGMARFSLDSNVATPAFEEAVTLGAQIAKHSQPKLLVHVWMMLSSRLHQVQALLLEMQPHSPRQNLDDLKVLIEEPAAPYSLSLSWDLAGSRLLSNSSSNSIIVAGMPYQHTRSLRMVLLDTIHGFYLKALAMLPRSELRSRLHRSLLRAGHCYGPMDPVSNIIFNTIWYDVNFPAAVTPVLDVIGPNSLTRLESRSFYGLISFLQTRYHDLSEHQIVRCLVAASGQLSVADPNLLSDAEELEVEQNQQQHCSDDRRRDHWLSSLYDDALGKMKQQSPCADVQEAYAAAATAAWHPNPEEQAKFLASWKEKRSLTFPITSEDEPTFDLHIICCVNEDGDSGSGDISYPAVLFFAEFDNEKEDDAAPLLLCQVHEPTPFAEHVRCLYCEAAGARIVHPPSLKFHGGGNELEEVIRGVHSLSNDQLICKNEHAVQHLYGVEEDFMYIDVN
ncbi:hypothetical protein PR202_ga24688 [Eleusine coracana subsp. coracana]|uniref:Uncharacterized protein n=1 Tax=Eleusine coracana subsp. coracana TaxID=191504 RepID=A0AAV5D7F3_ELECO|nr:hypothetical protein PR202_ga24688 [Eleusine coracana subsp. coracana]